jgi:hypothetical protein
MQLVLVLLSHRHRHRHRKILIKKQEVDECISYKKV